MKTFKFIAFLLACAAAALLAALARGGAISPAAQAAERKMPDVITLGAEAKLGPMTFSHTNHTTKKYNLEGTGPIECVKCHHTAQPESEVAKHPPLKTAWPKDRTTSLTAENFSDTSTPEVSRCRDCHARAEAKPKLLAETPQVKYEGSAAPVTLTNQQAFHRKCGGCHDQAMKARADIKAPKTVQCIMCHKKAAATT